MDIDYTGLIEAAPQYMGMTQYGEVDCMVLNASGTGQPDVLMETQISGTNEISLPDWGVLACSDPSKYVFKLKESKLTLNDPQSLFLPAKQPVNFDGSGTKTSPYIIKSYPELMGLAQLVNVEKIQEGVYYKLGSNIDCSNQNITTRLSARLAPAPTMSTTPIKCRAYRLPDILTEATIRYLASTTSAATAEVSACSAGYPPKEALATCALTGAHSLAKA